MTEKRFTLTDNGLIDDNQEQIVLDGGEDCYDLLDLLNTQHETITKLTDENEVLKQQLQAKYIVNKQYEENQRLIKMLNNVANYMQKEHHDMPIPDFVDWWNAIATEGVDMND